MKIFILFSISYLFYTSIAGLSWYGFAPIAQIVSLDALQINATYSNLLFDLSGPPPLLSILRKITIDSGINSTYIVNLTLLLISAEHLFSFAIRRSNKIYAYLITFAYLFLPATWLYNTYEYDVGMFVSLSIIFSISLFNLLTGKDKILISAFTFSISGFVLSILSSKWTVIHTFILIMFAVIIGKGVKARLVIIFLLSIQLILPIKNYMLDGIFANSTWAGLNLSMVTSQLPAASNEPTTLYTFYMSAEKLSVLQDCDFREALFMSPVFGCRYISASKSDLAISKQRILNSPVSYIERGLSIFKKNWLEFPDNYINSGMSYERLKFKTYQKPERGRYFWWFLNMIIFYMIPALAIIILFLRGIKNCNPLFIQSIIFVLLSYITMSLINGIELGRMKFYSFGYILLLVPFFHGSFGGIKSRLLRRP